MASINNLNKRTSSAADFPELERPAKRRHMQRVLAYIRRGDRQGFWVEAQQCEWDAFEAAVKAAPSVSLSTTATAEIIIVTAADLPYRVSEENMPSNFRRARAFFVDQMNIPPAKIRWFSVAFRH
jgi:hypothetical protein